MRVDGFEPEVIEEIIRRYKDDERVSSIVADFTAKGREITLFDVYQILRDADVPRSQRRGPRVVDIPGMGKFADRYRGGEALANLAADAGVSFSTMRANLVKAGLKIQSSRHRKIPNLEDLAKRHADGESMSSLAQEAGVSRATLKKRLAEVGEEK